MPEVVELAKLFDPPPDPGFEPRVRGLIIGSVHVVLHGERTARNARDALTAILKAPETLPTDRPTQRFLQMLFAGMDPLAAMSRSRQILTEARAAFVEVIGRGRPADETRAFFLQELVRIARDNGMELGLPQHRDQRNTAVTPFFTFALAMVDIVVSRVFGASPAPPSEAVRRRLVPFQCSRVGWLDALERAREAIKTEKCLENQ